MKPKLLISAGLGVLFVFAVLRIGSADGATMSHPSRCSYHTLSGPGLGIGGSGGGGSSANLALSDVVGSQLVNQTSVDKRVLCPIEELRDPFALGTVALDGWKQTSAGIAAKGCHTFTFGFGGACTPADPNTGTGVQHITIPSSAWHPSHYNYVQVVLKQGDALFGYSHTP